MSVAPDRMLDFPVWEQHEAHGMDTWLDSLETVLRAISQRRMTEDQLDRMARLLYEAEQGAIARVRRPRRVR
jgi:hypothetical protein